MGENPMDHRGLLWLMMMMMMVMMMMMMLLTCGNQARGFPHTSCFMQP